MASAGSLTSIVRGVAVELVGSPALPRLALLLQPALQVIPVGPLVHDRGGSTGIVRNGDRHLEGAAGFASRHGCPLHGEHAAHVRRRQRIPGGENAGCEGQEGIGPREIGRGGLRFRLHGIFPAAAGGQENPCQQGRDEPFLKTLQGILLDVGIGSSRALPAAGNYAPRSPCPPEKPVSPNGRFRPGPGPRRSRGNRRKRRGRGGPPCAGKRRCLRRG